MPKEQVIDSHQKHNQKSHGSRKSGGGGQQGGSTGGSKSHKKALAATKNPKELAKTRASMKARSKRVQDLEKKQKTKAKSEISKAKPKKQKQSSRGQQGGSTGGSKSHKKALAATKNPKELAKTRASMKARSK